MKQTTKSFVLSIFLLLPALQDDGSGTVIRNCPESINANAEQIVADLPYDLGTQDDYATVFINTSITIDVLANDGYSPECAQLVSPIIIVEPTRGSQTVVDKKIVYTPNTDFMGRDSLTYVTVCNNNVLTAKVYITISEMPDNVSDADCFMAPPASSWSIKELNLNNSTLIHNYGPLVVGDIDNDEIVEIIGYKEDERLSYDNESAGIKIFYYDDIANIVRLKREFLFSTTGGATSATLGAMAIARYNNIGHIVVAGTDKYLYAYNTNGGRIWKSDAQYDTNSYCTLLGIADFNNDSIPEVYTGNQIFSLSNGKLLCDGGTGNNSGVLLTYAGHSTIAADMDDDDKLELIAGTSIYRVTIANKNGKTGNSISTIPGMQLTAPLPVNAMEDGTTQVVDIDCDGKLEVVVISIKNNRAVVYVWKPLPGNQSYIMGSFLVPSYQVRQYSIPMLGNIDNDIHPEIVFIANGRTTPSGTNDPYYRVYALDFNPTAAIGYQISLKWNLIHDDLSGCTGATLFDFNQDERNEIVYRDETTLRILDGSTNRVDVLAYFNNILSGTLREYPVIADVSGDGQAEIIVTGWDGIARTINGVPASNLNGYLRVFKTNGSPWAPARRVWNQYNYNAVHINEDLTVPPYQINPATRFPGDDGILGTSEDIQPYNGHLMQQTMLSKNGTPIWLIPDVFFDLSTSGISFYGNTVIATIGIINKGDEPIGSPIYATLYKESVTTANKISTGSNNIHINPGDTGYVVISATGATLLSVINFIVRINDNGTTFPYQPECDINNNELTIRNPLIGDLIKKESTLMISPPFKHNGTYSNPVSVLFGENIKYEITAINAGQHPGRVIIRDTLPAYLKFVPNSANPNTNFILSTDGTPPRDIATWTILNVAVGADTTVSFEATPESGACASQPLFINKAWLTYSDTVIVKTEDSTYHQGAGVSIITFSAGTGGQIFNADPQAIDYRTTAHEGVLIVPDEGYRFTGWSHDDYLSLRGEKMKAKDEIMYYDSIIIYGNVELHAHFKPEEYPIRYYLNGGRHPENNPSVYTIESAAITLESPEKEDDLFIGWTGSNGDKPEPDVTIPEGSTGELVFFANFLHSGRQNNTEKPYDKDKIWATGDMLYINTSKSGSTVKIYSTDGILQKQKTILSSGESKIKLPRGIYIITLNNSFGHKIRIE